MPEPRIRDEHSGVPKLTSFFKLTESNHPNGVYIWRDVSLDPFNIPPLTVYRILKNAFGPPNGFTDVEEKSQWNYILTGLDCTVEIHDWKFYSWTLIVQAHSNSKEAGEKIGKKAKGLLLSIIKKESEKYPINLVDQSHLVIPNGFKELYSAGQYFVNHERNISKRVSAEVSRVMSPRKLNGLLKERKPIDYRPAYNGASKKYEFNSDLLLWGAAVSFALSAEALLNFVYELYLRPDVLQNTELVDRIATYGLSEKWRMAHLLCDCFSRPLGRKSDVAAALKRISDIRNNIAHGNISRETKSHIFVEDAFEFAVLPSPEKRRKYIFPNDVVEYEVQRIKADVDVLKDDVIDALKPKVKKELVGLLGGNSAIVNFVEEPIHSDWF